MRPPGWTRMKEQFQSLLLLGYPGEGLQQLTNHLERKGWEPFNRGSRHCVPILQDCLPVPSTRASACSGLTLSQMAKIHSSASARLWERGEWHSQAGGTEAQSWGTAAPLQGIHNLWRNRNGKSESGGMGEAGKGGGSGQASDRMEGLS